MDVTRSFAWYFRQSTRYLSGSASMKMPRQDWSTIRRRVFDKCSPSHAPNSQQSPKLVPSTEKILAMIPSSPFCEYTSLLYDKSPVSFLMCPIAMTNSFFDNPCTVLSPAVLLRTAETLVLIRQALTAAPSLVISCTSDRIMTADGMAKKMM